MRATGYAATLALILLAATAAAQEARTLKERLSDKASDPQRVDNCKVPPERRGPVPRPGCPSHGVSPTGKTGIASSVSSR
jgi:hypothetical protein